MPIQLSGMQVSVTVQMPLVNNLANPRIIHAGNITFSPGGILNVDNIDVVTMDSGTIFEFDTANHHYSITAPRDGFVINNPVNTARIAEFINSEFNNSITDPHVENNKLQGLREYANYQDKNALKEFIEMNFNVNCTLVDNFINDNKLYLDGVCANLGESILGDLPENILAHINSYSG